jgi:hypothetical protein
MNLKTCLFSVLLIQFARCDLYSDRDWSHQVLTKYLSSIKLFYTNTKFIKNGSIFSPYRYLFTQTILTLKQVLFNIHHGFLSF